MIVTNYDHHDNSLIESLWLNKNLSRAPIYRCTRGTQGVRFHQIRDFKQYYVNSIPPTSYRWLLTEEHIVRDIMRCAISAGNIEVLPRGSNHEPDFKSHLPTTTTTTSANDARNDTGNSCFLSTPFLD